jgi:tRNA pseudouridine55 synthase
VSKHAAGLDIHGVLIVDKPAGWTSHDVVGKVRRLARTKKVGHLGTLDPMSTGVLPLVLGRATRLAQFYGAARKVYEAEVTFGYTTDSYDADGEVNSEIVVPHFTEAALDAALDAFRGEFEQMPPAVSAKKIQGRKAYELAREGKEVELQPVPVTVHELTRIDFDGRMARLRVDASAGFYVRSLAFELGRVMGTGATLTALRRTRAGEFEVSQAHRIETLEEAAASGTLDDLVCPLSLLLPELPPVRVDETTAGFILQGRDFRGVAPLGRDLTRVRAIAPDGRLLAIGHEVLPGLWHPDVVL